jgi:hypothetical protein
MFRDAIEDSGVLKTAREDALSRLEGYFAKKDVDRIAARTYLDRELKAMAPHLWLQPQTPGGTPPPQAPAGSGQDKPRRPGPYIATPQEVAQLEGKSPIDVLTYAREQQAKARDQQ